MKRLLLTIFALLPLLLPGQNPLALKAKRVFLVSGPVIEDGVVLVRDGRIERVGAGLAAPAGYEVVDLGSAWLYPGLINANSGLGTTGTGFAGAASDRGEPGDFNPQIMAHTAFYSWSRLIPIARDHGTLVALTAPQGGMVSGYAVLVRLHGWAPADMFLKKQAALWVQMPEGRPQRGGQPAEARGEDAAQFSKKKKELFDFLAQAKKYDEKMRAGQKTVPSADFAALRPLWQEKLPVIVQANSAADIRDALRLGKELGLNLVLSGAYEAEDLLPEIKAAGCGVIVPSLYGANRKWEDGYDRLYRLPAALAKAGIPIAFSHAAAATAFDLPVQAARSLAYGLPEEEALKGLTLNPARLLGLSSHGSIEPGKAADLVAASGSIFDPATLVVKVFVAGRPVAAADYFQEEAAKAKVRGAESVR